MKDTNNEIDIFEQKIDDIYKLLDTSVDGISNEEAIKRLEQNGYNKFEESKPQSNISLFFKQFSNITMVFLNIVVLFSVIVSYIREESYIDSIIVAGISILNFILGYFQSKSANNTISEINKMFGDDIPVLRDNKKTSVLNSEIVDV